MAPYMHGVYVNENPTSVIAPLLTDSAVQIIIGTAPVNLADNPSGAVNKPMLVNSFAEAVKKVGYSDDFEKFTLCQAIDASFRKYNVAPLVLINVLDPAVHKTEVEAEAHDIENGQIIIPVIGIMLDETFVVKSADGLTTYVKDSDYTVEFNADGYPVISIISGEDIPSEATELSIDYVKLDPSAVDESDIMGGYNAATGAYTGLEIIEQVYPRLSKIPGLLLSPGWSHKPTVAAAMMAKTENINGSFKCECVLDVDTTEAEIYTDVANWKSTNGYIDKHALVCWPMVKNGSKKYYMSAMVAALIAYTDAQNEGVPFVAPSNKALRITGTILSDGAEVYLDQVQANYLNGSGIIAAININGWRLWGNNTGAYPASTDVKDRFIPVRRMFDWWGNSFIVTYLQKVDNPQNFRLIESLVDSENIRANGYKARYQIADAKIEFNTSENPTTDILSGIIRFKQYFTPFPPAETIINTLEFDASALTNALAGGDA